MDLSEVTPELREKVLACETPEEIFALAREVGRKLTDEELDAIAGGGGDSWSFRMCPSCGSQDVEDGVSGFGNPVHECRSCGYRWCD